VFTNFQWGTFRLDEESANLLANWRAMLEEIRFYVHANNVRFACYTDKCRNQSKKALPLLEREM
jgi:hypothetical protein